MRLSQRPSRNLTAPVNRRPAPQSNDKPGYPTLPEPCACDVPIPDPDSGSCLKCGRWPIGWPVDPNTTHPGW